MLSCYEILYSHTIGVGVCVEEVKNKSEGSKGSPSRSLS